MSIPRTALSMVAALALLGLAQQPAAAQEPPGGTLKKIADSGHLLIGHRVSARPFSFVGDDGTITGYVIDLCREVAAEVKAELGRQDLQTVFVPVSAGDRFEQLLDGKIDLLCGPTTNSLGRQQVMDFSSLTFVSGGSLLTRRDTGIDTLTDVDGRPGRRPDGHHHRGSIEERPPSAPGQAPSWSRCRIMPPPWKPCWQARSMPMPGTA